MNSSSPIEFRLYGGIGGIQYTASTGCPGVASGTRADGSYNPAGTVAGGGIVVPGITVGP